MLQEHANKHIAHPHEGTFDYSKVEKHAFIKASKIEIQRHSQDKFCC